MKIINTSIKRICSLFFILIYLLSSCSVNRIQNSKSIEFPVFDVESHRGGTGVMPENTIPAMLYSLSLDGLTTLEMDAHVTADNKLVLIHDHYLNPKHTLKPDGKELTDLEKEKYPIMQMTYNELKKFDVGSKFYKAYPQQKKMKVSIPLLEDVIDSVQYYIKNENREQVFYNIEAKSSEAGDHLLNPVPEVFVKLLMDVIKSKKIAPYVIIQSADVRILQVLRKEYPQMKTSYLVGGKRKDFTLEENLELLGFDPYIYSPNYRYLTKEIVEKCHEREMKVVAWTPNTEKAIDKVKLMGVDGIITDYPELLLKGN